MLTLTQGITQTNHNYLPQFLLMCILNSQGEKWIEDDLLA